MFSNLNGRVSFSCDAIIVSQALDGDKAVDLLVAVRQELDEVRTENARSALHNRQVYEEICGIRAAKDNLFQVVLPSQYRSQFNAAKQRVGL